MSKRIYILFLFFVFTSCFLLFSLSSALGATWNIQTVDSTGGGDCWTSIALDSSNYPHIGYLDRSQGDLKYASCEGTKWYIQTVETTGETGWYTSIALDSSNCPHISYFDATNNDLKYAKWTGSTWDRQRVDSPDIVLSSCRYR